MYKDYPLSKQQLGLWIEQRLHPSNTSYNTCVKVKLTGKLNVERFRQATQEVIYFFDTLKVYFVEKNGVPFQRIDENLTYLPEYIDISEGNKTETKQKAEQAKEFLSDKLNTPIDLTQFPIMRASLIKTAQDIYYFIGMVPHIVSDGRSAILYLESLSVAYNQGKQGLEKEYGSTKKNWQDYYDTGLDQTETDIYLSNKAHWQQRLKNAEHYFDYSYGKQITNREDRRGERVYFDLSDQLSQRLKEHSKANRTTLFNVFVCAFSLFIYKYYHRNDVLIGYPVNIRPPGYKHFFGFFVNILPIRVDMNGNLSYQELLQAVHQVRKEDKKHQKYPALDIVSDIRELLPDFDGRVFNLSMAQTVSRLFDLNLEGINSQPLDSEYYDVNDDFSLSYELIEQRIGLWFEYRKALFDREFINQAMQHIKSIIIQMLDFPDRKINDFKLLNARQQQLIYLSSVNLSNLNPELTETSPNKINTTVSLFEKQVNHAAQEIAVIDAGKHYNYQQLNQKANQLARKIIKLTDARPVTIAISLLRGFDLITCLLAVMKSGCAYVPLPINYPNKRKQFILQTSEAVLWIIDSDQENKENIECVQASLNTASLTVLDFEHQKKSFANECPNNLDLPITVTDSAYMIYTSGTTGQPKGVKLNHANLVCRLLWLKNYFNLSTQERMLQNTDFSFDVSVAEIFWPLISGACLVISDQSKSQDANYLLSLIENENITGACMVPSLLRVLISVDKRQQLSSIKHLLSAGEALMAQLRDDFYAHSATANAQLYNFYGPTEATIYSSFEKVSRDPDVSVTIGRPLAETALLILDEKLNLLPIGVVGQLAIGGAGVASGYHKNQQLNETHFVNDPFVNKKGHYLYLTGDLARYDFDGRLDYIGRVDNQIKIRGYRVELGEIETVIAKNPIVSDVAVIKFHKDPKQSQLLAYVKVKQSCDLSNSQAIEKITIAISLTLPYYMMPSLIILVGTIPRFPSGKLNLSLLPNFQQNITSMSPFEAAKSGIEERLVAIWSEILSIDENQISVNASFFDLGGDSLMAIQFVSIAEQNQLFFDMSDLFEFRNIRQLAKAVRSARTEVQSGHHSTDSQCHDESITGNYPLLPRQVKFFKDDFINPHHWNRTFSFTLNHSINVPAFNRAVKLVLAHHDNLRIYFKLTENDTWQQCCVTIDHIMENHKQIVQYFDYSDLSPEVQNKNMETSINQAHQQINLFSPPLIRLLHFSTGHKEGKLAIIFHHLLLDMVSSRLIFEDLMLAYETSRNNLSTRLPLKTSSVKDWVNYLKKMSLSHDFSLSLDYWEHMPALPTPLLPTKTKKRPTKKSPLEAAAESTKSLGTVNSINNESSAKLQSFFLDQQYTQKLLRDLPQQIGMPIQDFLLSAFFELIAEWSGCNSVMVNTCGHGREVNHKGFNLSRTVGWLNTVYPVHLHYPDGIKINQLDSLPFIKNIQQQLARVPKDNIEYNLLRYFVEHPKILKHSTPHLFFNYVGQLDAIIPAKAPLIPALDLPGLAGIDGKNHLCYQLYFEAGVIAGQLVFRLTYSKNLFDEDCIKQLTDNFLAGIKRRLTDICG